jgi:hypothetical protein
MKIKTAKLLPKIDVSYSNGGIYLQRVRCGKSNCKCARGETHTAYYYFARVNGKLRKTYVRKADLEELSELVDEAKFNRDRRRTVLKEANESVRETRRYLRENKDELEKQKHEFLSQLIRDATQPLIENKAK